MLTGENLPTYETLADYIVYTATGRALTAARKPVAVQHPSHFMVLYFHLSLIKEPNACKCFRGFLHARDLTDRFSFHGFP